jgi:hypothetical protein
MLSRFLYDFFPSLWHWLKYQQYLRTNAGEREIRFVGNLIPKGALVIDVGVHLGFYSRHFARLAPQVLAFEANPESAKAAARMLPAKVRVENVALSDADSTVILRGPLEGGGGPRQRSERSHRAIGSPVQPSNRYQCPLSGWTV